MKNKHAAYRPLLETALVKQLCRSMPALLESDGRSCTVHREVVVGASIADLVIAVYPTRGASNERPPHALSAAESVVLSVLRSDGALSSDELVRRTRLNGKTAGVVSRLLSRGLVASTRTGRIAVRKGLFSGCKLIAIEAKLARWRDALDQATAYRSYADEAYVALPEGYSSGALSRADSFREAGVGLLLVANGSVRKRIAAVRNTNHDWRREFVYSRVTACEVGGERSRSAGKHPRRAAAEVQA